MEVRTVDGRELEMEPEIDADPQPAEVIIAARDIDVQCIIAHGAAGIRRGVIVRIWTVEGEPADVDRDIFIVYVDPERPMRIEKMDRFGGNERADSVLGKAFFIDKEIEV